MKSKKSSMFLCHTLVSSIVVLMIGFLGIGVRVFATADTTKYIFFAALIIPVVILVWYFMLRRSTRELTARSLFREPPFAKRALSPRLWTISRNPLTLGFHLSERPSRVDVAVVKRAGDSFIV